MYVCVHTRLWHRMHVQVQGQVLASDLSFTMWLLGTELRLSDLEATAFTHLATLCLLLVVCWFRQGLTI